MQWFVNEQVVEETLAMKLLDKKTGGEKMGSNALYTFDRDMEKASDDVRPAQDATTLNP